MYLSRDQFITAVTKVAAKDGGLHGAPGDEGSIQGSQGEMQPQIEQPDQVPNDSKDGFRGSDEALNQASEELAKKETQTGYLSNALSRYGESKRQTRAELGNLLQNFGPESSSSSEVAKAASAVTESAFIDELAKIRQAG